MNSVLYTSVVLINSFFFKLEHLEIILNVQFSITLNVENVKKYTKLVIKYELSFYKKFQYAVRKGQMKQRNSYLVKIMRLQLKIITVDKLPQKVVEKIQCHCERKS